MRASSSATGLRTTPPLAGQASTSSAPLPPYAHEVVVRAGEAILLDTMRWHAVENLEPTLAIGYNEHSKCVGARFAKLQVRDESGESERFSSWLGARSSSLSSSWSLWFGDAVAQEDQDDW
jgi:hypothetical protein